MAEKNKKIDVLCFGGGDWWYHNRAHIDMQLMHRFAKTGTVVYINSIVIQKPPIGHPGELIEKVMRKSKSILRGLKPSDNGFWVYSPFSLPVHHIRWAKILNQKLLTTQIRRLMRRLKMKSPLIWVACPGACQTALAINKSRLVWQRTDRWEEFPNVDAQTIRQYDRKLKAAADLTVFVCRSLYQQEAAQCKKPFYLDHGVDYELFATAGRSENTPAEMAKIKRPIVGFFGGIDRHTFDLAFTCRVADLLPQMSFVFIGNASMDCSALAGRKNVRMLRQKPYEQIPHYGKCFDVAIMPWRQNRWIQACNPVKLKEYLALGKPVVSTPFPELKKYLDVVYQAQGPIDFAQCITKAIAENSSALAKRRRRKVHNATWDAKAQLILQELFPFETAKNVTKRSCQHSDD